MRYLLLILPCVASLVAFWYNRLDPQIAGIPFFYWFLILLIPVSSLFIWLASRMGGDDA